MIKHILFIIFSLLSISIFFTSCDDGAASDTLIGTWDYTERVVGHCMNANDNNIVDYSGNGDCETIDDITTCFKFSITMSSGNYTINRHATIGENETTVIEEEGTYRFQEGLGFNVVFCTDLICRTTTYTIANNILSLESIEANTECITTVMAEKR